MSDIIDQEKFREVSGEVMGLFDKYNLNKIEVLSILNVLTNYMTIEQVKQSINNDMSDSIERFVSMIEKEGEEVQ